MSDPPHIKAIAEKLYLEIENRAWRECSPLRRENYRQLATELAALVPSAPPATTRAEEVELVWLIERGQQENQVPTLWWVGGEQFEWTNEANRATKFPRRDIAQLILDGTPYLQGDVHGPTAHVVEHGFVHRSPDAAALLTAQRVAFADGAAWSRNTRGESIEVALFERYPLPSPPKRTVPNVLKLDDGSEWTYHPEAINGPWFGKEGHRIVTNAWSPYQLSRGPFTLTAEEHERAAAVMRHPTVEVNE